MGRSPVSMVGEEEICCHRPSLFSLSKVSKQYGQYFLLKFSTEGPRVAFNRPDEAAGLALGMRTKFIFSYNASPAQRKAYFGDL